MLQRVWELEINKEAANCGCVHSYQGYRVRACVTTVQLAGSATLGCAQHAVVPHTQHNTMLWSLTPSTAPAGCLPRRRRHGPPCRWRSLPASSPERALLPRLAAGTRYGVPQRAGCPRGRLCPAPSAHAASQRLCSAHRRSRSHCLQVAATGCLWRSDTCCRRPAVCLRQWGVAADITPLTVFDCGAPAVVRRLHHAGTACPPRDTHATQCLHARADANPTQPHPTPPRPGQARPGPSCTRLPPSGCPARLVALRRFQPHHTRRPRAALCGRGWRCHRACPPLPGPAGPASRRCGRSCP